MFLPLLLPALIAIGLSILVWRIVIGFLLRPGVPHKPLLRFPQINARWIGRQIAILWYRFKR